MLWKYPPNVPPADIPRRDQAAGNPPADPPVPQPIEIEWTVEQAFDLFTLATHVTVNREPTSISPAIDLMRNGYVAKTPENPSSAVSIKTLELFHRLRLRKPSFSAEALAKVICDYYRVSHIEPR